MTEFQFLIVDQELTSMMMYDLSYNSTCHATFRHLIFFNHIILFATHHDWWYSEVSDSFITVLFGSVEHVWMMGQARGGVVELVACMVRLDLVRGCRCDGQRRRSRHISALHLHHLFASLAEQMSWHNVSPTFTILASRQLLYLIQYRIY